MLKNDFLEQYNNISKWLSHSNETHTIYNAIIEEPNAEVVNFLKYIISAGFDDPNITIWHGTDSEHQIEYFELDEDDVCDQSAPWKITLNKKNIKDKIFELSENTYLFLDKGNFFYFLEHLDPFKTSTSSFDNKSHLFIVNGLEDTIGGEHFYAAGAVSNFPALQAKLPTSDEVHNLVHVNSTKPFRVCPRSFSLNHKKTNFTNIPNFKRSIAKLLAACLVQELRISDSSEEVTVKGSKKQTTSLSNNVEDITEDFLDELSQAVIWVYEERSETRLQLIMDRLSLDMNDTDSYLTALALHLKRALEQAKDSYAFVILDRKDDYHKEVRDLIKDMRTQADLYATKTRSLVSSLARDTLGVLVFFSFSFMARAQSLDVKTLLTSKVISLILIVIGIYLTVSLILQLAVHLRDDHLTKQENGHWLKVLQNYTRTDDQQENFLKPIKKRRKTFHYAMGVIIFLYCALIYAVLNLQCILTSILNTQ